LLTGQYSFFGSQEGDFSLSINSIKAISQTGDIEKHLAGVSRGIQVKL
jgi:hypothetical protein